MPRIEERRDIDGALLQKAGDRITRGESVGASGEDPWENEETRVVRRHRDVGQSPVHRDLDAGTRVCLSVGLEDMTGELSGNGADQPQGHAGLLTRGQVGTHRDLGRRKVRLIRDHGNPSGMDAGETESTIQAGSRPMRDGGAHAARGGVLAKQGRPQLDVGAEDGLAHGVEHSPADR